MEVTVIKKAKVTVSEEVRETINVDYPTQHKFFRRVDDGNWFPRGIILFAILVKYPNSTFILCEVERGKQFYTDFVPTKDCRQDYWLSDTNDIRRTALSLLLGEDTGFKEISKEEFVQEREQLLNEPIMNIL